MSTSKKSWKSNGLVNLLKIHDNLVVDIFIEINDINIMRMRPIFPTVVGSYSSSEQLRFLRTSKPHSEPLSRSKPISTFKNKVLALFGIIGILGVVIGCFCL